MHTATTAVLEPLDQARVALESVDIQAGLRGLMSEVEVSQVYRNLENRNIEAVYTFPLPLDAVLMELTLELNGKKLKGVVQSRAEASARYEDAMEEGDSAVLLENAEPGMFTMNVGNILPQEKAVIKFRYAQLHRWQGDSLRMHLPTTIAPRYGDPQAGGLQPHQIPEHSLSVDYGFSLTLSIEGDLALADFECPSHPVAVSTDDGVRKFSLSGGSALMDRDFILTVRKPSESAINGLWAKDGKRSVALAAFHPAFPENLSKSGRCVKLVVDCSGSMGGESIAQAKLALKEIISYLKPNDYFNLIRFGSGSQMLFTEPVIADKRNVRSAKIYVDRIDADMGGTEIGGALDAAYGCGTVEELPTDLLLITDGEVWNSGDIMLAAQNSGHRIFTVGVGHAPSESFVRLIAETTRGAYELVSPREDMAERIVRHFSRIDQPKASSVRVAWSESPDRQVPADVDAVYAGDTVHVFGWFKGEPASEANLVLTFDDGRTVKQKVPISMENAGKEGQLSSLTRIAAHSRLAALSVSKAASLAEKYQLVTKHTSCVLVYEREGSEKSTGMPDVRVVPHRLAAGWGGVQHYRDVNFYMAPPVMSVEPRSVAESRLSHRLYSTSLENYLDADLKAKSSDLYPYADRSPRPEVADLIEGLNLRYSSKRTPQRLDIFTVNDLISMGLDRKVGDALHALVDMLPALYDSCDEESLVAHFLVELLSGSACDSLARHVKRMIRQAGKEHPIPQHVAEELRDLVRNPLMELDLE